MARLSISSIAGSRPKHFHRIIAFCRHRMEILSSPDLPFLQYQEVAAFCPVLAARPAFGSGVWNCRNLDSALLWPGGCEPAFLTSALIPHFWWIPWVPSQSPIWLHWQQVKSPPCSIMLVFLQMLIKPFVIPGNKLDKKHSTQCLIIYFVALKPATVLSLPCVRKTAR